MYRRRRYPRRSISKYSWTKEFRFVTQGSATGQATTLLYDALVPSVVKSITIDPTNTSSIFYLVVVVKSGESVNSVNFTDGQTFYEPESNVMLWCAGANDNPYKTNTVRKLNPGDKLYMVTYSSAALARQALCQFYVGS